MINVKLCMMVVLIELYPLIPLSVTLIAFQGHSSVKKVKLKILYSYLMKLKLCMIIDDAKYVMNIPLFLTCASVQRR